MFKLSFRPLNGLTAILFISVLLIIDQWIKISIKLNYPLSLFGQEAILDWGFFKVLFVENKGMAMGTRLDTIPLSFRARCQAVAHRVSIGRYHCLRLLALGQFAAAKYHTAPFCPLFDFCRSFGEYNRLRLLWRLVYK